MKFRILAGRIGTLRLLLLLMFFSTTCIHAKAEVESDQLGITLDEAIVLVLEKNPELSAFDYEAGAAAARIRQAQLGTPYTINLDLENFAGSGVFSGFSGMESTLSIARVLELGEKPRRRGDLAETKSQLLRTDQDARRLDLVAETARRFLHVVSDQEKLVITTRTLALAQGMQQAVEQRVLAGKTGVAERYKADIAVARVQLELEHGEHELQSSRLSLSTLWAQTSPAFDSAQADLYLMKPVEEFDSLATLLDRNPNLIRLATEQRVDQARTALAQSRGQPDIQLAGGVRYLGVLDEVALVLSASVPLGSRKRAENRVEESRLSGLTKPLLYENSRLALYSTLYELYQELLHARTAVEVYRGQIIPSAEQALSDYEAGYSTGRYSLLELTDAQKMLLDARLQSLKAAGNYHRNQIEIERLTGAALNSGENL